MPKAQMVFKLAKDTRGNRNGFCRYIGNRRKAEESMGLLLNRARDKLHRDLLSVTSFYTLG